MSLSDDEIRAIRHIITTSADTSQYTYRELRQVAIDYSVINPGEFPAKCFLLGIGDNSL